MKKTRATCLNCMDGRAQAPVLNWITNNYPVDFVDVITHAGMDAVLAGQEDIAGIVRQIEISFHVNGSSWLFVVGHHDCRGNPVDDQQHKEAIAADVKRLKTLWPDRKIAGLWINDRWQVEPL